MAASEGLLLTITGGTLVLDAEGDGRDSNGYAVMTGGTVVVNGPTGNGNGAIDVNGSFEVSGGTLLAAGSAGMAGSPSTDSAQGWVSAAVDAAAGSTVQVVSADGEVLATFTAAKDVSSLVYSSADVETEVQYEVLTGGTATGEAVGGLSTGGDATGATSVTTVTAGEQAAGAGGMGGGPGCGARGGFGGGAPAEESTTS